MDNDKITLFVSYSHDDDDHIKWVKKFVKDLRNRGGFNVLYDQDLEKGASLPRFMESGIEMSEKVLVIGTPEYKRRAALSSGVGFEEAIMGTEYMNNIDSTKFYPILRRGSFSTSFPIILTGRKGDDFRDDCQYEDNLVIVIKSILESKSKPMSGQRRSISDMPLNEKKTSKDVEIGQTEKMDNMKTGIIGNSVIGNTFINIDSVQTVNTGVSTVNNTFTTVVNKYSSPAKED